MNNIQNYGSVNVNSNYGKVNKSPNFKAIYPKNVTVAEVVDYFGINSPFARNFTKYKNLIENSDVVDMYFQRFPNGHSGFRDIFLVLKKPFKTDKNSLIDVGTKVRTNPFTAGMAKNNKKQLCVDANVDVAVDDYKNMCLKYKNKDKKIVINLQDEKEAEIAKNELYAFYGNADTNIEILPTLANILSKSK